MYRVFATFSICYRHGPTFNFKTLIGGCLDDIIANILTDIAYCIRPHVQTCICVPRYEKTLLHIQKHMGGTRTADQHLCFSSKTEKIINFSTSNRLRFPSSVLQLGLCRSWSVTQKAGLLMRHILTNVSSIWATFLYNGKDHICRNIVSRDLLKHKNVVSVYPFAKTKMQIR